ncbi:hypothetical protein D3C85_1323080 [compost metagenome]
MRFRKKCQLRIAAFFNDFASFVIPNVANALEKQQRENVSFEVSRIHRTAQNVGGCPQMAFELAEGDLLYAQTRDPSSAMPLHCGLCSNLAFVDHFRRAGRFEDVAPLVSSAFLMHLRQPGAAIPSPERLRCQAVVTH